MNINIVRIIAKKHAVITFDIFDTLVERDTFSPSDIFVLAGAKVLGNNFGDIFKQDRIEAERKAREKKVSHEVTLLEIYDELKTKYSEYAGLMTSEIDTELECCHAKTNNVDLLKLLKQQGKKIYLISDMYLSENVIRNMLDKCGILQSEYDGLYVSNVYGNNKLSGELFKICIESNNLEAKDILHIGDSFKADFLGAHKAGIKALLVKRRNRLGRLFKK